MSLNVKIPDSMKDTTAVCTIIIPTHSSYLDVCYNFLEVFHESWKDCRYTIVLSVTGEDICKYDGAYIYNGKHASLTDC